MQTSILKMTSVVAVKNFQQSDNSSQHLHNLNRIFTSYLEARGGNCTEGDLGTFRELSDLINELVNKKEGQNA